MTSKVAEILNQLDEFFASPDTWIGDKRDVWNILSALRGPDDENQSTKRNTTVPLRRMALPKTAKASDDGELFRNFGPDFRSYGSGEFVVGDTFIHFGFHAAEAWRSLNRKELGVI